MGFVDLGKAPAGPKGDPGHGAVDPKLIQGLRDDINKKHDKILSSDNIPEGPNNLYFTTQKMSEIYKEIDDLEKLITEKLDNISKRIVTSDEVKESQDKKFYTLKDKEEILKHLDTQLNQIKSEIDKKMPVHFDSSDIKEGKKLYFTNERAIDACASSFVSRIDFQSSLSGKQDRILDSDQISPGKINKFYDEKYAREIFVEKDKFQWLISEIDALRDLAKKQKEEIESLKKSIDFKTEGANGSFTGIVSFSSGNATYKTFVFENGLIKKVSDESKPKVLNV